MLDQLVSMLGQLDPKDAEIVKALAEKYGVPTETAPVEAVKPADPTVMNAPAPEQVVMGSGQPLPAAPEQTVEAPVQEGQAPVPPVAEKKPAEEVMEAVAEAAPVAPAPEMMPQPSPAEEVKMMVADLGNQLVSLKTEIEALKASLEKVAVREPVTEDEATLLEAKKQNIGQRVKGQPSNIPDKSVMSDLIKKLGGLSK